MSKNKLSGVTSVDDMECKDQLISSELYDSLTYRTCYVLSPINHTVASMDRHAELTGSYHAPKTDKDWVLVKNEKGDVSLIRSEFTMYNKKNIPSGYEAREGRYIGCFDSSNNRMSVNLEKFLKDHPQYNDIVR